MPCGICALPRGSAPTAPWVATRVTAALVRDIERDELAKIKTAVGDDFYAKGRYDEAQAIFEQVALSDDFQEFLTLPAYEHLD